MDRPDVFKSYKLVSEVAHKERELYTFLNDCVTLIYKHQWFDHTMSGGKGTYKLLETSKNALTVKYFHKIRSV